MGLTWIYTKSLIHKTNSFSRHSIAELTFKNACFPGHMNLEIYITVTYFNTLSQKV